MNDKARGSLQNLTGAEQQPLSATPYSLDSEFTLRGAWDNPMLDAAGVLFGLAGRLRTLDEAPDLTRLYTDVSNQIRVILEEIRELNYDDASFKAYSYSLCLFMDERVMSRPWGRDSSWSQNSLLSQFHQETWGGEKFFTLLTRMSAEAPKYKHVLEFMYFAVALGLRGKYAMHEKGSDEIEKILVQLQRIIRELRGPAPAFADPQLNVAPRHLRLSRQWPWWSPWVIAGVLMVAIYTAYSMRLNAITAQVLEALEAILKL